jgi:hypothetical protein
MVGWHNVADFKQSTCAFILLLGMGCPATCHENAMVAGRLTGERD